VSPTPARRIIERSCHSRLRPGCCYQIWREPYVLGESGAEIENKPLGFYREEFYHYVNNFSTPRSGTYTLGAELNPLRYNRHEVDGEWKIFTEPLTVEFGNVEIDTEGGT
jgi:hypothetical protein